LRSEKQPQLFRTASFSPPQKRVFGEGGRRPGGVLSANLPTTKKSKIKAFLPNLLGIKCIHSPGCSAKQPFLSALFDLNTTITPAHPFIRYFLNKLGWSNPFIRSQIRCCVRSRVFSLYTLCLCLFEIRVN
jgi:hypothetical protein